MPNSAVAKNCISLVLALTKKGETLDCGCLYVVFPFFQDVVGFLNLEHIPYRLSGSVAMSLYPVPRATKDMDFVVELQAADVNKLAEHFSKAYYCDKDSMMDSVRRKQMFNIIDYSTGIKADFFPLSKTV